ncbi:hypothetical protein HMPREF0662_02624 [Prevotella nigrescens F0103]|nr:hypothetical protein HMPREF0662_02624 [Prevotella nigrescens F0103]
MVYKPYRVISVCSYNCLFYIYYKGFINGIIICIKEYDYNVILLCFI